jgi:hypothetical protein
MMKAALTESTYASARLPAYRTDNLTVAILTRKS